MYFEPPGIHVTPPYKYIRLGRGGLQPYKTQTLELQSPQTSPSAELQSYGGRQKVEGVEGGAGAQTTRVFGFGGFRVSGFRA